LSLPFQIPDVDGVVVNRDGGESFFLIAGGQPPTQIPEPTTLALVAIAMLGLGAIRRRRTV